MDGDSPAVVFHPARKGQNQSPQRGYVEVDGHHHPAWWAGANTAHTTAWLTDTELVVQHWRYHPQYDEAPEIRLQRFLLSRVLTAEGQADTQSALIQVLGESMAGPVLSAAADRVGKTTDDAITWFSVLSAVLLLAWLITGAVRELADDGAVWWHARIADDLVAVSARVLRHEAYVFSSTGSWARGPAASDRNASSYATPTLEAEYTHSGGLSPVRATGVLDETFGTKAKALAYLAEHYPIGSEIVVLKQPNRGDRFLLSSDQAPSTAGMLVRLSKAVLVFLFVHLPLVVLFAMLVPPWLVWIVTWPFLHRRK